MNGTMAFRAEFRFENGRPFCFRQLYSLLGVCFRVVAFVASTGVSSGAGDKVSSAEPSSRSGSALR